MLRDVDRAEEVAQDAFVAALTQWPQEGVPRNPGAWLMTTAKRRAVDAIRRDKTLEGKTAGIVRDLQAQDGGSEFDTVYEEINDDVLRLMFVACHPVLSAQARVALTLRLIGGLTTAEIARAFLTSEPTIAQRIVRAKRALTEARVPFEVPSGHGAYATLGVGTRSDLSHLQRRLRRDSRRGRAAPGTGRRCAARRAYSGRAHAG